MSCRQIPTETICNECKKQNGMCKAYCRDAFVYDNTLGDDEIIKKLRSDYSSFGGSGDREFMLKLPQKILDFI